MKFKITAGSSSTFLCFVKCEGLSGCIYLRSYKPHLLRSTALSLFTGGAAMLCIFLLSFHHVCV